MKNSSLEWLNWKKIQAKLLPHPTPNKRPVPLSHQIKFAREWILALFGTAVGAGILYLPIQAGIGGIHALLILTIVIGPIIYLAHNNLAILILTAPKETKGLAEAIEHVLGNRFGFLANLVYFLAIFPILLVYAVGLTNVLGFIAHLPVMHNNAIRFILASGIISLVLLISWAGEKTMLWVIEWLVYPLVLVMVLLSIYFISLKEHHNLLTSIMSKPIRLNLWHGLWHDLPIMVFAFNFSPALSSLVQACKRRFGQQNAKIVVRYLIGLTVTVLLLFIMFFVYTSLLHFSMSELLEAKRSNRSILSFLAQTHHQSFLLSLSPLIAAIAIASSFFGHYLGASESLSNLLTNAVLFWQKPKNNNSLIYIPYDKEVTPMQLEANLKQIRIRTKLATLLILGICMWLFAVMNPNILTMIETVSGPALAILLFIIPVASKYTSKRLASHRKPVQDAILFLIGLMMFSNVIYLILSPAAS